MRYCISVLKTYQQNNTKEIASALSEDGQVSPPFASSSADSSGTLADFLLLHFYIASSGFNTDPAVTQVTLWVFNCPCNCNWPNANFVKKNRRGRFSSAINIGVAFFKT